MIKNLFHQVLKRAGLESTIARNSIFLLLAEAMARAVNFALGMVLARYLKPAGSGALQFVIGYGILFSVLAELGITRLIMRDIARNRTKNLAETLGQLEILRLVITTAMLVIIWGSLFTRLGAQLEPRTRWYIFAWTWSMFFQAMRRNSELVFLALEQMKYQAAFLMLNRLLAASLMVVVIIKDWWIPGVLAAYITADAVDAIAARWFVRTRIQKPVYRPDMRSMWGWIVGGLPFAIQMFAGQVYYYVGTVLLRYLYHAPVQLVEDQIGLFSRAYQIVLTLIFVPLSVCNAIFPSLAMAYKENDHARMKSLFGYSFSLLFLTGLPLAMGFYLFRADLMTLIFGRSFRPAAPMLALVVWMLPLVFLTTALGNLLAATDKQRFVTITTVLCAIFIIVVDVLLLPRLAGRGAAIGTTATEGLSLVLQFGVVLYFFPRIFDFSTLARMSAFHGVWLGALFSLEHSHLVVRVPLYAAYAGLSLLWARALILRRKKGLTR